jgi:hypothetical protein
MGLDEFVDSTIFSLSVYLCLPFFFFFFFQLQSLHKMYQNTVGQETTPSSSSL